MIFRKKEEVIKLIRLESIERLIESFNEDEIIIDLNNMETLIISFCFSNQRSLAINYIKKAVYITNEKSKKIENINNPINVNINLKDRLSNLAIDLGEDWIEYNK